MTSSGGLIAAVVAIEKTPAGIEAEPPAPAKSPTPAARRRDVGSAPIAERERSGERQGTALAGEATPSASTKAASLATISLFGMRREPGRSRGDDEVGSESARPERSNAVHRPFLGRVHAGTDPPDSWGKSGPWKLVQRASGFPRMAMPVRRIRRRMPSGRILSPEPPPAPCASTATRSRCPTRRPGSGRSCRTTRAGPSTPRWCWPSR